MIEDELKTFTDLAKRLAEEQATGTGVSSIPITPNIGWVDSPTTTGGTAISGGGPWVTTAGSLNNIASTVASNVTTTATAQEIQSSLKNCTVQSSDWTVTIRELATVLPSKFSIAGGCLVALYSNEGRDRSPTASRPLLMRSLEIGGLDKTRAVFNDITTLMRLAAGTGKDFRSLDAEEMLGFLNAAIVMIQTGSATSSSAMEDARKLLHSMSKRNEAESMVENMSHIYDVVDEVRNRIRIARGSC